ncbi:tetratricopeptide repeat protein [Chitinivibrio alkaliphilus]|uniref:Uncharacterized protein n=1 Tax=Chitinivibrio alkaliphilus ACht1 TaxID=1313304 RepID=U7D686_9BACT|nr:tetratricopeptide repeat protein [Chitinivibrio alkaliphilus]ERP31448.1 hypothetical protein CALK_1650 [Chitinivibrio alkaliphilus ACht1]
MKLLLLILFCTAPLTAKSLLDQAAEKYQAGAYTEAITLYKEAVRTGLRPALAYFNMGNAYYSRGDIPQAIAAYRFSILEAPGFLRPYHNLAVLLFSQEAYAETIALLERAMRLETEPNTEMMALLGSAYYKLSHYEKAIPLFVQLAEMGEAHADIYYLLYTMYEELKDREQSRFWLQNYPEDRERDFYDKYTLLSDHAFDTEQYDQALLYIDYLIESGVAKQWNLYRYIEILGISNRPYVAVMKAHEFLESTPDFPQLALLAGNIAFEEGLYNEAETFFQKAYVAGAPQSIQGLENIYAAYGRMGVSHEQKRIQELLKTLSQ